jgi:hypothetical protein
LFCFLFNSFTARIREGEMGGQKSLRFVFGIALVVGVVLTVTTWAAPPKPQSVSAAVAKGAIYRPALWKVY